MKKYNKIFQYAIFALTAAGMASCVSDEPFGSEGDGFLKMRMVINSEVTRAQADEAELRDNCVVYISSDKGLIKKYKGLDNVPENIPLKGGQYVAEAWTGDSVSASFDKKFFRGYQPFTIQAGVNSVVLRCNIANVLASVNAATVDPEMMKDWKITIGNSAASLDFTDDNVEKAKGYFMMPYNEANSAYESELTYTVTGTNASGTPFEKKGVISGVQRAHEYVLNIKYNPDYMQVGGSYIDIIIDDSEVLITDEIELFSAPVVKGVGFNLDKQVVANAGAVGEKIVKFNAFGDIKSIIVSTPDWQALNLPTERFDILDLSNAEPFHNAGLEWEKEFDNEKNTTLAYIQFMPKMLNALPERDTEYVVNFSVTDSKGKTSEAKLRLAVGENAVVVEAPIVATAPDQTANRMAVLSRRAVIPVSIVDETAVNPGLEFREAGTIEWSHVAISSAASAPKKKSAARKAGAKNYNVTLKNLKPSTRYEIRVVANNGEYVSDSFMITTEGIFAIPNAGMEDWGECKQMGGNKTNVPFPGAGTEVSFWDTGNHGSMTMNKVLTGPTTDVFHSGSKAANLQSMFVGMLGLGKFAAGNMFAGTYAGTDGTDGILELGRPYDGSHPAKLRVYANYRPGVANSKGGKEGYIARGETDQGQIYVALTTEIVDIRTKKDNQKLFDKNSSEVVAYGEVTWKGNVGADGVLECVDIPIEYYSKAKTEKPLYLVIVCTASKFGDFFSGGEGSTLILDDFELIYE